MKNQLQKVFSQLNPRIPAGSDDTALQRIPRDEDIVNDLMVQLEADDRAKVLLSGHIGVGKSTELIYLAKRMKEERFVIQCSISRVFGIAHTIDIFSMLIIVLHAIIKGWQSELQQFPKGLAERLVKYHLKKIITNSDDNYELLSLSEQDLEIDTGKQLLNLYSRLLKELALQSPQLPQKALPFINSTVETCNIVLNELANTVEKPVMLVIDDLDKIREESSQINLFLEHAKIWADLPCSIAATIPLEIIYSLRGRELDDFWGNITILNPLPVPEGRRIHLRTSGIIYRYYSGDDDYKKFDFYRKLLDSVDALSLFSPQQYLKLAAMSGGLPRSFVNSCADCVKNAMKSESSEINDSHIQAYERQHLNKWRGRLNDEDYEALLLVLRSGGANLNKPEALRLLRDGILLRDDTASEEQQICLTPWTIPLVEAYCKRKGKKYPEFNYSDPILVFPGIKIASLKKMAVL